MKKAKTTEDICIQKIECGIRSIKNGNRTGEQVDKDLDYFFNKLETLNRLMYEELYLKYCLSRLEKEKDIKGCV
jgi:hypothetical protein